MAKWYGRVGYVTTEEDPGTGNWLPKATEIPYSGDLLSNTSRYANGSKVNEDITLANRIRIVADPFAGHNYSTIKYVEYMGVMWEVSSIDASQYPGLVLILGGVYNGPQAETA